MPGRGRGRARRLVGLVTCAETEPQLARMHGACQRHQRVLLSNSPLQKPTWRSRQTGRSCFRWWAQPATPAVAELPRRARRWFGSPAATPGRSVEPKLHACGLSLILAGAWAPSWPRLRSRDSRVGARKAGCRGCATLESDAGISQINVANKRLTKFLMELETCPPDRARFHQPVVCRSWPPLWLSKTEAARRHEDCANRCRRFPCESSLHSHHGVLDCISNLSSKVVKEPLSSPHREPQTGHRRHCSAGVNLGTASLQCRIALASIL